MKPRLSAAALTLLLIALGFSEAAAVSSRIFRYARMEDYKDCSFRGLVMTDDGSWRAGDRWSEAHADSFAYFTKMAGDGRSLLIAAGGPPNRLLLFDVKKGRAKEVATADEKVFSSVAALAKGSWAVGTGPDGQIHGMDDEGDMALLFETGETFVWDMLLLGDDLWIATGGSGKVFRYDTRRRSGELVATLPDVSVFCLAADPVGGGVLAGTSGAGLLYRIEGDGKFELLADFEEEELQRLLVGDDGTIYIGAARSPDECENNCSAVYRLAPDGLLELMLSSDSAFVGDLIAARAGGLLVATGDAGELDRLTDLYRGEVLALEEGAYFSDLYDDGKSLWLLQSKPARLFRIGGPADEGALTSEVIDVGSRGRAGPLRVEGRFPSGGLRVEARWGRNPEPGPGWGEWRECKERGGVHEMDLPVARYFQWRVTLRGDGPRVDRITASFRPLNRSPIIGNLSLLRPTDRPFDDTLDLSGKPVTQLLERGVRVQYQQRLPSEFVGEEASSRFRGLRQVQWDWLDPDLDRLSARIEMRSEKDETWQTLEKEWMQSVYTWDGRGLPDGRYRLRVTITDEPDNRAGGSRSMSALSESVLLDGSAPEIALKLERLAGDRLRVRGTVSDLGGGVISEIERRDAEGKWIPLLPVGDFLGRPVHELDVTVDMPGADAIFELRAADEFGNWSYFRRGVRGGP